MDWYSRVPERYRAIDKTDCTPVTVGLGVQGQGGRVLRITMTTGDAIPVSNVAHIYFVARDGIRQWPSRTIFRRSGALTALCARIRSRVT